MQIKLSPENVETMLHDGGVEISQRSKNQIEYVRIYN